MEEAFELQAEIPEKIRTGIWVSGLQRLLGVCSSQIELRVA